MTPVATSTLVHRGYAPCDTPAPCGGECCLAVLTPYGYWYAMRLRLLAHLGDKCKVEMDGPEFMPETVEELKLKL